MYIHVLLMIIYLFKIFHMSKEVISSLSVEDLELLSDMATYLLSLKAKKSVSPVHDIDGYCPPEFYLCTESVIFTREELSVLKKLKHLHLLRYDTK